jgi:hypothetical protein
MQKWLLRQKALLQVAVAVLRKLTPRSQPDTIPDTRASTQPAKRDRNYLTARHDLYSAVQNLRLET